MILSLETSTKVCSLALHDKGQLIASQDFHTDQSHSSVLPAAIESMLSLSKVTLSALAAIAVSAGPGSYTGLRIGVSAAKALAYGLGKPLIAIPSLHVLAEIARITNLESAYIVPMLDARRMEVYTMMMDQDGQEIQQMRPLILDETTFDDYSDRILWLVGDGASKCRNLYKGAGVVFRDDVYPEAKFMGRLAYEKFERKEFEDIGHFEPLYLKEFQTKKPRNQLAPQD